MFRKSFLPVFGVVIFAVTIACAALAQERVEQIQPVPSFDSPAQRPVVFSGIGVASANLQIGPGDLLAITVFDVAELAAEVRVSNSGEIEYPLLGTLKLLGMTATQAGTLIADRLRAGNFVRNPSVNISIREYATQGVAMLGEVRHPGAYPATGTHNLLDFITAAGGLTQFAGHTVTITHSAGEAATYTIDTRSGQSWKVNPQVQPGDRIEVARAGIIYVLGDVAKPGGFVVENGEPLTVLKVVALAGGNNRTATLSKARLLRKSEQGTEDQAIALKALLAGKLPDMELRDNDILYIPGSEAKAFALRSAQSLLNAVGYSAVYAAR